MYEWACCCWYDIIFSFSSLVHSFRFIHKIVWKWHSHIRYTAYRLRWKIERNGKNEEKKTHTNLNLWIFHFKHRSLRHSTKWVFCFFFFRIAFDAHLTFRFYWILCKMLVSACSMMRRLFIWFWSLNFLTSIACLSDGRLFIFKYVIIIDISLFRETACCIFCILKLQHIMKLIARVDALSEVNKYNMNADSKL